MGKRTVSSKRIGSGTIRGVARRAVRSTLTRNTARTKIKNRQYRALHRSMAELHEDWVKANIEKSVMRKMVPAVAAAAIPVAEAVGAAEVGAGVAAAAGGRGLLSQLSKIPLPSLGSNKKESSSDSPEPSFGDPKKGDTKKCDLMKEDEEESSPLKRSQDDIVRENIKRSIIDKAFVSEAQRRYFHWAASKHKGGITKEMAHEFESKTPKNKKLPQHVGKKK